MWFVENIIDRKQQFYQAFGVFRIIFIGSMCTKSVMTIRNEGGKQLFFSEESAMEVKTVGYLS